VVEKTGPDKIAMGTRPGKGQDQSPLDAPGYAPYDLNLSPEDRVRKGLEYNWRSGYGVWRPWKPPLRLNALFTIC